MKSFIILSLSIFSTFALAEQRCGDTVGASLTILSSIQRSAENVAKPETTIGLEAAKSPERLIKYLCSELGSQVSSSFSINTSLRLYTAYIEKNKQIPIKINEMIDGLTTARNTYCFGAAGGSKAIKGIQEASAVTSKKAEELRQLLDPPTSSTGQSKSRGNSTR